MPVLYILYMNKGNDFVAFFYDGLITKSSAHSTQTNKPQKLNNKFEIEMKFFSVILF